MARAATMSEVVQALELARQIGEITGERDEARRQVKELTERLANCRCSQVVPRST